MPYDEAVQVGQAAIPDVLDNNFSSNHYQMPTEQLDNSEDNDVIAQDVDEV